MAKVEKGQHGPLNVSQKSRHRIVVGLGWDPNAKFGFFQEIKAMLGGKKVHHDLDLSCYTYDADGNPLDKVTADPDKGLDESGRIYHSGDSVEGFGGGDDEQISVELKKLDETVHHIVFLATIKSGHTFGEVDSPEIRLADGYSDHNFLTEPLNAEEGKAADGFIFTRIYRQDDGWSMHNISQFCDASSIEGWKEHLKQYLN